MMDPVDTTNTSTHEAVVVDVVGGGVGDSSLVVAGAIVDGATRDGSRNSSLFKTSLPPRKRAKTQEEKEQRKIERILRNRRAAHASREKKRKHVEYLEVYVVKLEENFKKLHESYQALAGKLSSHEPKKLVEDLKLDLNLDLNLDDLSELKGKIHSNMNCSRKGGKKDLDENEHEDEDEDEDEENEEEHTEEGVSSEGSASTTISSSSPPKSKKRKLSRTKETKPKNSTSISTPPPSTSTSSVESSSPVEIKLEKCESPVHNSENDNTFFNYLSPVSLNSPATTPIDLTLTNNSNIDDLILSNIKEDVAPNVDEIEASWPLSEEDESSSHNKYHSHTETHSHKLQNESNLSMFETGQNSAVILSVEQEKQQPIKTLVDILNHENCIKSVIAV
ncbi:uncharacterized protein LODBEIA_P24400 [Lodderomyces beijingensis]|uniref:BZIP domain-containing protein n=1 Tax=Lodderomyces beijingensis TaxID=1775926 RepID=A0ABP0ZJA3_9ASCO